MKKYAIRVAAVIAVCSCMMFSSCIGSFKLTNKLLTWNTSIGNKFVNELVFFAFWILPVYEVSGLADILVLNSIEFWSGNNPMAQRVGTTTEVMGQDGRYYAVTTLKNGYKIKKPTGEEIFFVYDKKTKTWSEQHDGQVVDLFTFNDDGTIQAYMPNGESLKLTQDEAGLFQARMAVHGASFYACR